jgi:HAD superfamily hydrolase (TIGR01459 family)
MSNTEILAVDGLRALRERHSIFLVDQFGVLHDGQQAYPGAVEGLVALKASGARVVLISNSGKRAAPNETRLEALGFRPGSWDLFLSSGEVAWRMFADPSAGGSIARGARVLLIARDGDVSAVDGLDVTVTDDAASADVVLLSASEGDRYELDHYRDMLAPAARRGVPMICTNPDKIMLTSAGPRFGAGRIAERYEDMGGVVTWIGKPFPEIYAAALAALGDPPVRDVVCVGDSVEHDIAGAKGAGLAAALVRSGILAEMDAGSLAALFDAHRAAPDYLMPAFIWNGGEP